MYPLSSSARAGALRQSTIARVARTGGIHRRRGAQASGPKPLLDPASASAASRRSRMRRVVARKRGAREVVRRGVRTSTGSSSRRPDVDSSASPANPSDGSRWRSTELAAGAGDGAGGGPDEQAATAAAVANPRARVFIGSLRRRAFASQALKRQGVRIRTFPTRAGGGIFVIFSTLALSAALLGAVVSLSSGWTMIREMREKLGREIEQLSHELNILLPQPSPGGRIGRPAREQRIQAALERQQFVQAAWASCTTLTS